VSSAARATGTASCRSRTWSRFEQIEEAQWRVREGAPSDKERLNPAHLVKAAAAEGWDVLIPGNGYDYPPATPEEIVIVAGPAGPIDPIVRLPVGDRSAPEEGTLYEPFFFLTDPSGYESDYCSEISFEGALEMGYSGFVLAVVLSERSWGMPDFRESMVGWVSHSGGEVVCAWALPGEYAQGTWERTVSGLDDGPEHPRFWLTIAREIARPS
jgi:hypothetical protein